MKMYFLKLKNLTLIIKELKNYPYNQVFFIILRNYRKKLKKRNL